MHTVTKGDITVLRIAVALVEQGEKVLKPVSENERYDLALDRDGLLYRIQCKTGRYRGGSVLFKTCSVYGRKSRDYRGQIEAFGVYCPDLGTLYLVPIEKVTSTGDCYLRVDAPKNGQQRGVLFASEFEFGSLAQQAQHRSRKAASQGSIPWRPSGLLAQ